MMSSRFVSNGETETEKSVCKNSQTRIVYRRRTNFTSVTSDRDRERVKTESKQALHLPFIPERAENKE